MRESVRHLVRHHRPSLTALVFAAAASLPLFLAGGCGGDDVSAGGPPWGGGGGRPPAVVRTAPVETGSFTAHAEYVGTLEARSAADLYARSSGPVVEIRADLGDRVREGQVLAVIEGAEERERIEEARANLRMAEATLAQRRAALDIARTTAQRSSSLFEQDLVSRQQLDSLEAEVQGARAQVQLAEAQVEQSRSALSSAEVELQQTRVVAPFDGVVGRRYLDRGAFAATNSPVLSVVDLSIIKITIPVPERDAAALSVGQPATVRVGSLPGEEFPGRVARMAAVFDPESATTRAEVEVDNLDGRLKPGMFATVEIALADETEALLVPAEAVLDEDGRSWIFVVAEAKKPEGEREGAAPEASEARPGGGPPAETGPSPTVARRLEVRTLGTARDGDAVAVEGDLEPGQRIIVLGHEGLTDGAAVTVATEGDEAASRGRDSREVTP